MRLSEACCVGELLDTLPSEAISPVLNVGSSTGHFRKNEQPHIDRHIFEPLCKRNVVVIHVDLKQADGVDYAGDVLDEGFQHKLRSLHPKLIMCSNLLEHLTDPFSFLQACAEILEPGGYLLITGPRSYPYHLDPIDTMYRPGPTEIQRIFPDYESVFGKVISSTTYLQDLSRRYSTWKIASKFLSDTLKMPLRFVFNFDKSKASYHRYLWLFRPYTSTVVLLRKPKK